MRAGISVLASAVAASSVTPGRSNASVGTRVMPPLAGDEGRGRATLGSQNSGASASSPAEFILMNGDAMDGNPNPSGITPITRYRRPFRVTGVSSTASDDPNRPVQVE